MDELYTRVFMVSEYNKTVSESLLLVKLRQIAIWAKNDRQYQNWKKVT